MARKGSFGYLERLEAQFKSDPSSVDSAWHALFTLFPQEQLQRLQGAAHVDAAHLDLDRADLPPRGARAASAFLARAYLRSYGHLAAQIDPLGLAPIEPLERLIERACAVSGAPLALLEQLSNWAQRTYSGFIGYEGLGWGEMPWQKWLIAAIEEEADRSSDGEERLFTREQAQLYWYWLWRAELLERFLHTKFVGQKRFSIEGHEVLIPALHQLFCAFSQKKGQEVFIAMAHRGRLNVLAQILNKSYFNLIEEFMEKKDYPRRGGGDVKYHKGLVSLWKPAFGVSEQELKITLSPNPSHLEAVNPVVMGQAYARGEEIGALQVLPIMIHGDAAFSGQGVVYETLQLMRLKGYSTSGSIHIILNNQVGFTATPQEARSTTYASDLAKAFDCPIFHVNADEPQAVHRVFFYALELRERFGCDVVIDLVGYRRWGHNESDEPRFTQPQMYEQIQKKKTPAQLFEESCQEYGFDTERLKRETKEALESAFKRAQAHLQEKKNTLVSFEDVRATEARESLCKGLEKDLQEYYEAESLASPYQEEELASRVAVDSRATTAFQLMIRKPKTALPQKVLFELARKLWNVEKILPEGFRPHPKVAQLLEQRLAKVEAQEGLDWGCCELLAYASLLYEGKSVRLSGQDCARGTFSHRQVVLKDLLSEASYNLLTPFVSAPPQEEQKRGAKVEILNSALSEFAVMGFEYGVSQVRQDDLTIWEAQFGDFCNGAQVIIDQFLSSAQSKWGALSRLVLFLPHGYEGQGPEHSSARIERFLALSARENWNICQVTRPAQLFHLLRRQVMCEIARPLVLFTPKGLLRHPLCTSSLEELTRGSFEACLFRPTKEAPRAIVLCSGRIYYDLCQLPWIPDDICLATLEHLYPLPLDKIHEFLDQHPTVQQVIWIQEEPVNMGAMTWIRTRLWPALSTRVRVLDLGRARSASTATGYVEAHKHEMKHLLERFKEVLNRPVNIFLRSEVVKDDG